MEQTLPSFLFCPGGKSYVLNEPTGQHTPDQSAHSCGAEVTQEQKCLASSGGKKTCFCGVTKYLNIISVLYRQTHNAVYYLERKHSFADVGKTVSGEEETPDFVSTADVREDETLIATEFCQLMHFVNYY